MTLSRATAAKVSAYYTGWVDPEEFAEFADKGLIYRQRPRLQPNRVVGFFVIGKGDKGFPMDLLTNLDYAAGLLLVLPYDAVNKRILEILQKIENARSSEEGEHPFEIDVIADVGVDVSTGETKYACSYLASTSELAKDYEQGTVKNTVRKYEKVAVTLTQVDDFTPTAKHYKVSDC